MKKRPQSEYGNSRNHSIRNKSLHKMRNEAPVVSGKGVDVVREIAVKHYQINLDNRLSQPKIQK